MATLRSVLKRCLPGFLQDGAAREPVRIENFRAETGSLFAPRLDYRSPYRDHRRLFDRIESRRRETQAAGALPLWKGYEGVENYPTAIEEGASRSSSQVGTTRGIGEFYTWLVLRKKPSTIVEFGAAFGISGMFWLTGLEINRKGRLFTFEPNDAWATLAQRNLAAIGDRYTFTRGTFEDNYAVVGDRDEGIDMAFIDAIHTSEFVNAQLALILKKAAPGALIVFDDIDFSDDMHGCWDEIRKDADRFSAAFEANGVGIVELR